MRKEKFCQQFGGCGSLSGLIFFWIHVCLPFFMPFLYGIDLCMRLNYVMLTHPTFCHRNYEFLLRNSPLLLSPTGKLLMFRKVLSMSEYKPSRFFNDVGYFQSIGSDWMNDLSYPELIAVRNFNQYLYQYTDGTVKFYRNCLGHIREHEVGRAIWSDGRILQALEDDVPRAMPEWYHSLMGLKPHQCISHCG